MGCVVGAASGMPVEEKRAFVAEVEAPSTVGVWGWSLGVGPIPGSATPGSIPGLNPLPSNSTYPSLPVMTTKRFLAAVVAVYLLSCFQLL